jgi:hypothetical protein
MEHGGAASTGFADEGLKVAAARSADELDEGKTVATAGSANVSAQAFDEQAFKKEILSRCAGSSVPLKDIKTAKRPQVSNLQEKFVAMSRELGVDPAELEMVAKKKLKRDVKLHTARGKVDSTRELMANDRSKRVLDDIMEAPEYVAEQIEHLTPVQIDQLLSELENLANPSGDRVIKASLPFLVPEARDIMDAIAVAQGALIGLEDALVYAFAKAYYTSDHFDIATYISALERRRETIQKEAAKQQDAATMQRTMQQAMQQAMQQQLQAERQKMREELLAEFEQRPRMETD